jgi:hypothetical protein
MHIQKLNFLSNMDFTSNNSTPVKISIKDKRFIVFECDNCICKNEQYFGKYLENENFLVFYGKKK